MKNDHSKQLKFKNKPFWYDPVTQQSYPAGSAIPLQQRKRMEHWDSLLEFNIYKRLLSIYPASAITRQYKLPVLPEDETFPKLTWDVDFAIFGNNKITLVEAKGEWILKDRYALSDFIKLMRIIKDKYPLLFENLYLVSDSNWQLGNTKMYATTINTFKENLKLKELCTY